MEQRQVVPTVLFEFSAHRIIEHKKQLLHTAKFWGNIWRSHRYWNIPPYTTDFLMEESVSSPTSSQAEQRSQ